jgi:hypothetical protein
MATLFDRLNRELEAFGRRAQEVLDESRTRLELVRLRNLRDSAARELGYLWYRRERQTEDVEQGRLDAALFKLDDLNKEIERLEQQLAAEAAHPDQAATSESETAAAPPSADAAPQEPAGDAPPAAPI